MEASFGGFVKYINLLNM